jgi:hypothetical protein
MTLVEMTMAMTIMGIMASVLAALALSVQESTDYNVGRGTGLQHARVTLGRINQMLAGANAATINSGGTPGEYPGAAVVYDQVGNYTYPDTLLIWNPAGTPANPNGPPLVRELLIYCPDPAAPNQLIELTAPSDARAIPLDGPTLNVDPWKTQITLLKSAATSQKTILTKLLRTASVPGSNGASGLRGAVRFGLDLHPSLAEMSAYQAGSLAWSSMQWPAGVYSSMAGLRQVWVRTELQLMPPQFQGQQDTTGQLPLPFFGSATLSYQVGP